ncbi:hypothetical protein KL930_002298 [Ogataea haglerorum]|uniref:BHLH domain-containing protein n=1 Tax=Ogataea haglerorum TaxID=1937702 RepID=A0AAN6I208_9ASCO|nr:uncharacterized protein KL911_000096 [Ogataea haglerorum]KAG7698914.1 hypothetical protein KL915_001206 [Ogataea haglerorum]KAG7709956.1 hypothetical protein KL914_000866 [Ogataea haglerorum]KAG7711263.1 hypothetical protein KL950_001229 [Ogataea haglerorum]KAG7720560.1 hypothetical protein KL913_001460 [Ogataea haglerorum]KAG7720946.1 hypothetical protein KL949_001818 [Ogataea haglerorum]
MTSLMPASAISKQNSYIDSSADESHLSNSHPPDAENSLGSHGHLESLDHSDLPELNFESMELQWSEFTNLHEIQHLDNMIHHQHADRTNPADHSHHQDEDYSSFASDNTAREQLTDPNYHQPPQMFERDYPVEQRTEAAPAPAVRPNDVFTPLVSPAVTPLEHAMNPPHGTGYQQGARDENVHKKIGFSPLTSPALEFQSSRFPSQINSAASLRQKRRDEKTSNMSPPVSSDDGARRASYKRSKTPNGTPLFGPANPNGFQQQQQPGSSARMKQSPSVKPSSPVVSGTRRPYRSRNKSYSGQSQNYFDMLPESATSNDLMLPPSNPPAKEEDFSAMELQSRSYSQESEPGNKSAEMDTGNPSAATPAAMMSFALSKLSAKNSPRMVAKDNVLINPNHNAKSAQSSPVILPSSNSFLLQDNQQLPAAVIPPLHINGASKSSSRSSSLKTSPVIQNNDDVQPSQSPEGMYYTKARSNSGGSTKSSQTDRKMTHKLAEQGRRNRMNVAIQDLEKIIPDTLKNEVAVPSKATTVELSSKYIQMLQKENKGLQQQLAALKQELEILKGGPQSQESISPFRVDGNEGHE